MTDQLLRPESESPVFARPIRVGQFNLPVWQHFEAAMRGIFERRYYTNQGPAARQFEGRLEALLKVRHAICVTNPTIGLMMAIEALGISGRVLVPGVRNQMVDHALAWCGLEAAYCDVDPATGMLGAEGLSDVASMRFSAVLGANLWGDACDLVALEQFATRQEIPLILDSSHAFGCQTANRHIGGFGAIEVLSFDESDILNAAGGGCVTTNDDKLAARLRNIRSSYGAGRPVQVVKTSNGRMSEAQAALGLLSLDDWEANRLRNLRLFDAYCARLNRITGIRVIEPQGVTLSNHQALICEVDAVRFGVSRDKLIAHLARANVEALAVQATQPQPSTLKATTHISECWLSLPVGAHVSEAMVLAICDLVEQAAELGVHARGEAL
jgi:dTDP-4-amino-4,6-dideoxygalactose transaminase